MSRTSWVRDTLINTGVMHEAHADRAMAEVRAEVLNEAADAIVAENDRKLWASKPGKHWAADLLRHLAAVPVADETAGDKTGEEPIALRWDRTVIHPAVPSEDDVIICCTTMDDGRPAALFLDDEHREALGLQLIDPDETAADEQPETAEFGVRAPSGVLTPTFDRAEAERRLARLRDMYPDAALVQRTVRYGPWIEVQR
ncbi:hypothetical protein [Streptomyces sp. NBC_01794]|uniref:hypothetical protein n=1 Tax=Streptomyces sp. NBC_01794 TaxID=2975942 RepID=UPI0030863CEC|nr:hypothetical protein OIE54_12300 [Streptomyces sp. NBC_01794]